MQFHVHERALDRRERRLAAAAFLLRMLLAIALGIGAVAYLGSLDARTRATRRP